MTVAEAARAHVVDEHRDSVVQVIAVAKAAAGDLDQPAGRDSVVAALEEALDGDTRTGLIDALRGAVAAIGRELQAAPVPSPPYLVVTARGPIVRATLADGRLVVLVRAFERDGGGYVLAEREPAEAVEARFRRRP